MEYCPVGISKLSYLQTLNGVKFKLGNSGRPSGSALQWRDLKGLTHLRHLSIIFVSSNDGGDVTMEDDGTFRGMKKMRTLSVRHEHVRFNGLHLPTDMEAMERLEILHLSNCVVPKWIFQLQNLMELSLDGPLESSSADKDIRGIEKIPNLKKLYLRHFNIEFPNEFGEAGAFPKLEELHISEFHDLKSTPEMPSFHEDAMPKLKCLKISGWNPIEAQNTRILVVKGIATQKNFKQEEVTSSAISGKCSATWRKK